MLNIKKYAEIKGYTVNEEVYDTIVEGLAHNEKIYKRAYCPCIVIDLVPEVSRRQYICPCKDSEDNIQFNGQCHCMLFQSK